MTGNPLQPIRDTIFENADERWPAANALAHIIRKAHIGDEREERQVVFDYLRDMLADAERYEVYSALVNGVVEPSMQAPELMSVIMPWIEHESHLVRMATVLGTEKMDWIYKKRFVASGLADAESEVRDAAAGSVFYTLKYQAETVDPQPVAEFWSEFPEADVDPEIRRKIDELLNTEES